MPLGQKAQVIRTPNQSRWTIATLHKQIQRAVKLSLQGQDLHLVRCVAGRVLEQAAPQNQQAEIQAIFDFATNGGVLRGQVLAPRPTRFDLDSQGKRVEIELPPTPWTGLHYVADPTTVGGGHLDLYSTFARSLESGIGDCDDAVIFLASLLKSIGYQCYGRYALTQGRANGHNVVSSWHTWASVEVRTPKGPALVDLDATNLTPSAEPGWRVSGRGLGSKITTKVI